MILKIKEDNSIPAPLLPLGTVTSIDRVAVVLSPPSTIISAVLFFIIH